MLTVMINGSPKAGISASGCVLEEMKKHFPAGQEFYDMSFRKGVVSREDMEAVKGADSIVIAFPLYVDGVPSHMLRCMEEIRDVSAGVYAVCNCGFYEAEQNRHALEIVKNWCRANSLQWRGGLGIGGGGALSMILPKKSGIFKRAVVKALKETAKRAARGEAMETTYVRVGIPGRLYKMAAETNWRRALKNNGLTAADLTRRL